MKKSFHQKIEKFKGEHPIFEKNAKTHNFSAFTQLTNFLWPKNPFLAQFWLLSNNFFSMFFRIFCFPISKRIFIKRTTDIIKMGFSIPRHYVFFSIWDKSSEKKNLFVLLSSFSMFRLNFVPPACLK